MFIVFDCMVSSDHTKFLVRRCDGLHQSQRTITATEFAVLLYSYGLIDRLRYGVGNIHNRAFPLVNVGEASGKIRHVFDKNGRLILKFKPVA